MVRHIAAALIVALQLGAGGLARDCGGADDPPSGKNAPCTRQKDCSAGLVCSEGVCKEPDAGPSAPDAAAIGDAADGGG